MIRSMTGYGRGESTAGEYAAIVEMRSVNHRYADIKLKLPAELADLERELQERIRGKVQRGRLEVTISVARAAGREAPWQVDRALVASYIAAAHAVREEFKLSGEVTLQTVLSLPDVIRGREPVNGAVGERRGAVLKALDGALASHEKMRAQEGEILARDILKRVARIEQLQGRIAKRAPKLLASYAKKLSRRASELQRMLPDGAGKLPDGTRLAQEVALLAEKADITEELVRLAGYLEQLGTLMTAKGEPVGKKLDFVMQEMNREANTINSKATDLAVCQDAIEIKAELEKIREQAQNIE